MKKLIFCSLLFAFSAYAEECTYQVDTKIYRIQTMDRFGCEYESRNLQDFSSENFILRFEQIEESDDLQLSIENQGQRKIFDVIPYSAPETDKIRDVVFDKAQDKLVLLIGDRATIKDELDEVEVDAAFYSALVYQMIDGILIKIQDQKINQSFDGIEGFYDKKESKYPYKSHSLLVNKVKQVYLTDEMVLLSLIDILKPDRSEDNNAQFRYIIESMTPQWIASLLGKIALSKNNLQKYNDIAYFLEQNGANDKAILILEKIINQFPSRTVAHLNLADAYWNTDQTEHAKKYYRYYIEQMKRKGKVNKIPPEVIQRAR